MPITWPGRGLAKRYSIGHRLYWLKILDGQSVDVGEMEEDSCRSIVWERKFRVNKDSFDANKKHQTPTQYNAYTDGSLIHGRVGCGVVLYKGNAVQEEIIHKLKPTATVFMAEIEAIKQCAVFCTNCLLYTSPSPRD